MLSFKVMPNGSRPSPVTNDILLSVPPPNVGVRIPQSEPYLAGMYAELRCSISLDNAVDTPVGVAVAWLKDGRELNGTVRVQEIPLRVVGGFRYDASLRFSTLSTNTDSGNYMCSSTVFPTENGNYITNSTETSSFALAVTGILTIT